MRLLQYPSRLARLGLCAAASVAVSLSFAVDEPEPDPWFTQDRTASATEEEEDASGRDLMRKSPRALVKQLKSDYDATPEGNLTRRISLLEEAVSISADEARGLHADLAQLKSIRSNIERTLDQASSDSDSLLASIRDLGIYAKYFTGDSRLLFKLLESPFAKALDTRARSLSRNNGFADLRQLQDAIETAGLRDILGSKVSQSANASLARQIQRKWQDSAAQFSPLPGESYLVSAALGLPDARIPLAIDFPSNVDSKLARNVSRSIERGWQDRFQIVPLHAQIGPKADLTLEIDAEAIETSVSEDIKTVRSSVPGRVTEEPNPDFLALAKKYEKAAEGYESALKSYEMNYKRYIEQFEQGEYDYAQRDLKAAQEAFERTPPPQGPGGSPEFEAAKETLAMAESIANSISPSSMPEPVKPLPRHHALLEELYLMPSTITTSEESKPYEYTSKDLDYQFRAKAVVSLTTRAETDATPQTVVSLDQRRSWTKNLGVDPKDPTADEGSYSKNNIDSALDIFTLEFGARCSEKLRDLLNQATERLAAANPSANGLGPALTYLALKSAQPGGPSLALSQTELAKLAELANSPDVTPEQFRLACLQSVLAKSQFSQLADEKKLSELL